MKNATVLLGLQGDDTFHHLSDVPVVLRRLHQRRPSERRLGVVREDVDVLLEQDRVPDESQKSETELRREGGGKSV